MKVSNGNNTVCRIINKTYLALLFTEFMVPIHTKLIAISTFIDLSQPMPSAEIANKQQVSCEWFNVRHLLCRFVFCWSYPWLLGGIYFSFTCSCTFLVSLLTLCVVLSHEFGHGGKGRKLERCGLSCKS